MAAPSSFRLSPLCPVYTERWFISPNQESTSGMRRAKESSSPGLSFTACPRRAEGDAGLVLAACHPQRTGSAFSSQGHFINKINELQIL
ncbi:hypothetical protein LEMLEM_LOCUS24153 [Lemmus lemmus]